MDGFMNILMYAANESLYIGEVHLYATVVSALLLAQFVRTDLSEWRFVSPFLRLQDSDRYLELTHCPSEGARNV